VIKQSLLEEYCLLMLFLCFSSQRLIFVWGFLVTHMMISPVKHLQMMILANRVWLLLNLRVKIYLNHGPCHLLLVNTITCTGNGAWIILILQSSHLDCGMIKTELFLDSITLTKDNSLWLVNGINNKFSFLTLLNQSH
jgi:hypothetical protein